MLIRPLPTTASILEQLKQQESVDFVSTTDNESSMLRAENREKVLNEIWPNMIQHYGFQFKKMGGSDGVLKNLIQFIVQHLPKNEQKQALSDSKARANKNQYYTALRVLLGDPTYLYPNLLHSHSKIKENGILLRDMLAYYWLAASDPEMVFSELLDGEVETQQQRLEKIEESKEIFISVLQEIRRAHNTETKNAPFTLDDPSCAAGTFGRIALRSAPYNKISAFPIASYNRIPAEIKNFIAKKLTETMSTIKNALSGYVNNTLMLEDVAEEDKIVVFKFLDDLSKQQDTLLWFLKTNIENVQWERLQIQSSAIKIFNIELRHLRLQESSQVNGLFIERILNICKQSETQSKLEEVIKPIIIQYGLEVWKFRNQFNVLKRAIDNELIRNLLAPHVQSEKSQMKREKFLKILLKYEQLYKSLLENNLDSKISSAINDLKNRSNSEKNTQNLSEELIQGTLNNAIPKHIATCLKELGELINELRKKLSSTLTESQLLVSLPRISGQPQTENHQATPEQWALNIIRVAIEAEQNGELVYDQREIQRIVELMLFSLSLEQQTLVLKETGRLLMRAYLPANKREEASIFIREIIDQFNQPTLTASFIQALQEGYTCSQDCIASIKSLLNLNNHYPMLGKFEEIAALPIYYKDYKNVCLDLDAKISINQEMQENYTAWTTFLLSVINTKDTDDTRKEKIMTWFIVLTVMRNLNLNKIRTEDIDYLQYLHRAYLTYDESQLKAMRFPYQCVENPTRSIQNLLGHLSCLLTTLKNVEALVESGHIRLIDSKKAEELVQNSQAPSPYLIRPSTSTPETLAVTCKQKGTIKKLLLDIVFDQTTSCIQQVPYDFLGRSFKINNITPTSLTDRITTINKRTGNMITPIDVISLQPDANLLAKLSEEFGYHEHESTMTRISEFERKELYTEGKIFPSQYSK